jgi:hypothetical protein
MKYYSLNGDEWSNEPITMFDKVADIASRNLNRPIDSVMWHGAKYLFLGTQAHEQLLSEVNFYGVEAGRKKLETLQNTQFYGMTVHIVPTLDTYAVS